MASRTSVLKTIGPLALLLLIGCRSEEPREAWGLQNDSSPMDQPSDQVRVDSIATPKGSYAYYLGHWVNPSGTDTLSVDSVSGNFIVQWRSTKNRTRSQGMVLQWSDEKLIGDFDGLQDNVTIRSQEGKLLFSIDPYPGFESVKDAPFLKFIPKVKPDYVKPSEDLVFSFDTKDGHHLSIAKAKDETYLVYRFGSEETIEMEFPKDLTNSWTSFFYTYYLRGGGLENEGLDENLLRFHQGDLTYTVQDTYYAPEDQYYPALVISNERTGKKQEIDGLPETMKGTLIALREYASLREEPEETIAWHGQEEGSDEIDERLMLQESLGELRYNMRPSQVKEQVGQPDRVKVLEKAQEDGLTHSYWYYDDLGLKVEMVSDISQKDQARVEVITIQGESPLVTDRWIGIGSMREEVIIAYYMELAGTQSDSITGTPRPLPDVLIIGELGGMRFKFKEDKVVEIMLGRLTGS